MTEGRAVTTTRTIRRAQKARKSQKTSESQAYEGHRSTDSVRWLAEMRKRPGWEMFGMPEAWLTWDDAIHVLQQHTCPGTVITSKGCHVTLFVSFFALDVRVGDENKFTRIPKHFNEKVRMCGTELEFNLGRGTGIVRLQFTDPKEIKS